MSQSSTFDVAARRDGEPGRLRRVGRWDLVCLAAEGSLARVYRARPADSSADCPALYALKLLRPAWQEDRRAVELLRREALVGRSVVHPHLIAILQANLGRPPQYMVMPWLDGITLQARLAAGRQVDLPVALWIARQVAVNALDDEPMANRV